MQHGIIHALREWAQILLGWVASASATAALFLPSVNQFFAAVMSLVTILWTVDRWRQTRRELKLRELQLEAYEENVHSPAGRSRLRRFLNRLTTPGEFDSNAHHGK